MLQPAADLAPWTNRDQDVAQLTPNACVDNIPRNAAVPPPPESESPAADTDSTSCGGEPLPDRTAAIRKQVSVTRVAAIRSELVPVENGVNTQGLFEKSEFGQIFDKSEMGNPFIMKNIHTRHVRVRHRDP
jgi:hypothetical protein